MSGDGRVHVAHIIGSTGIYGAERWILAQSRYLDPKRARVSIVNLVDGRGKTSALVAEAERLGYDACDFDTGGRFNPLAPVRLARLARRSGYGVLHSHGYKSDLAALAAARLAGVKVIATPHGWAKENDKKLVLYEKLDRALLRFFDHVCPLSPALYDGLRSAGVPPSKMTLIWNGVDVREVDEAPPKGRTPGLKRIGYLGQLIERKGLDDLIQAFFLLQRTDCELFFIGEGPLRGRLERRARSSDGGARIHFPGYSARRLEDLKSFDVLALPSLEEGVPRCVMEAQAAGVPVVGTDIEGLRDLVADGRTGLLVPPENPAALARAVNRLLDAPALAAELAGNARQSIDEKFSAEKMARQYESLYVSLPGAPLIGKT